jgi:very-short-patch-repair endonuclease
VRPGEIEAQFEADVAAALQRHGLHVQHRYPACGFQIGLVIEDQALDVRVGVECDGAADAGASEEEIERQDILERAGWRIVRIPYRGWLRDAEAEVARVVAALRDLHSQDEDVESEALPLAASNGGATSAQAREWVSREQRALVDALQDPGPGDEDSVFTRARDHLEAGRLTQKLRRALRIAASDLAYRGLIAIEDGEYFILETGRQARYATRRAPSAGRRRR